MDLEKKIKQKIVELALKEDKVEEDITTNSLISYDKVVTADVSAKEPGTISGVDVFTETFKMVDPDIQINIFKGNGSQVEQNSIILKIKGRESSILRAERTALNFLQRLSGISTLTKKFVDRIKHHKNIVILDTRKTTPGMRYLEKKAVRDGGARNHRMDLEEMAMVKDNHIKIAGSIKNAVKKIKEKYPEKKIEVEVKNISELNEALSLNIDFIMLDNFNTSMIKKAVKLKKNGIKFEVSGNITLENIPEKVIPGIDFISVGALTHSYKSLDLSLNISR